MTDKVYCVYVHRNTVNGKQYCGITSQKPEYRWRDGDGYAHNTHFQRAIQKYGWGAFEHIVLCEGLSHQEANALEQKYILEHSLTDQGFGYNQTAGGDGTIGYIHTEETRRKMSASRTGREFSLETRMKISEKNSGERNGMYGAVPWNKGLPMPAEVREKISQNRKGKCVGELHPMYGKSQSGELHPRYGKHHSKESLQKISASLKGKSPWNKGVKTGITPGNIRRVGKFNDDGVLLEEFDSIAAAATAVGGRSGGISSCCRGRVKHSSGYVWKYLDKEVETV